VFTSVSIGIALSNSAYEQPDDILRDADTAMYRAKSLGKARSEAVTRISVSSVHRADHTGD